MKLPERLHFNSVLLQILLYSCCLFPQIIEAQNTSAITTNKAVIPGYTGIAGNFGEIRSGHFHSGIDYKTDEREGFPVYAAADGYISRIKISRNGYGKALYINHPNGLTTVYGHLRVFYPDLEMKIIDMQYEKEEYELEIFPQPGEFPVSEGQIIAWSGNTGGSLGPHLHFETRNTLTENPFDPVTAGFGYPDSVAPVIQKIVIYETGPYGSLFGSSSTLFEVDSLTHKLKATAFTGSEEFFIGFTGYDYEGESKNTLGIPKFRLFKNDSLVFDFSMREFAFSETRFANACIDYAAKKAESGEIVLCHKLEGNQLNFFGEGNGIIKCKPGEKMNLKLIASDLAGNADTVEFIVTCVMSLPSHKTVPNGKSLNQEESLKINEDSFRIIFPEQAFYETVNAGFSIDSTLNDFQTAALNVFPENNAVNQPLEIAFNIIEIPEILQAKADIVRIDSEGKISSEGGSVEKNWIRTTIRNTGKFSVVVDTLPPFADLPVSAIDDFTGLTKFTIKVSDDLTGIKNYKCHIDDEWVIAEFNAMHGEIIIYVDEFNSGAKSAELQVDLTDQKLNSATYKFILIN